MKASLTIRTYTKRMNRHTHVNHHQLVLPTQGNIYIDMDGFVGKVAVGDCIVIPQALPTGLTLMNPHVLSSQIWKSYLLTCLTVICRFSP